MERVEVSTFAVVNFGCRAARADGEAVAAEFRMSGLSEQTADEAAVVVVNTCSVTAEADRETRAFVRRVRRRNPAARIVVTGCYAQRAPEEVAALEGVSAVVGNSHKEWLAQIAVAAVNARTSELISAARLVGAAEVWADDAFAHSWIEGARLEAGASTQTRPNLKIQEGCGNRCSFCVIPLTRGASRSMAAERVLERVEEFVATGGRELVLSGINLGRWGRELEDAQSRTGGLSWLVGQILEETRLERLRLSSVEPMDWTAELIATVAGSKRVARHAHLPLQSGADAVLRRMHRRYRPWHYAAKVEALRQACGDELAIGADVMVGFPGETESEFEESLRFVRSLSLTYLHLFPFSARPGTAGWAMHREKPVAAAVVKERMARMQAVDREKRAEFRVRMRGRELMALTLHTPEKLRAEGKTLALTESFLEVELDGSMDANESVTVRLVDGRTAKLERLVESQGNSGAKRWQKTQ